MKVEYRIENLRTDQPEQHLNELGAEGWELVAPVRSGSLTFIFIRRPAPINVFMGGGKIDPEGLEAFQRIIEDNYGNKSQSR